MDPAKYTPEEIEEFKSFATRLVSRPIVEYAAMLFEGTPLAERVRARCPYDKTAFLECAFEGCPLRLVITLGIVPKTHVVRERVPTDEAIKEFHEKCNLIRLIAIGYWQEFIEKNSALHEQMCAALPDVDLNELVSHGESAVMLTFAGNTVNEKCIGIITYYVDEEGRPCKHKDDF